MRADYFLFCRFDNTIHTNWHEHTSNWHGFISTHATLILYFDEVRRFTLYVVSVCVLFFCFFRFIVVASAAAAGALSDNFSTIGFVVSSDD